MNVDHFTKTLDVGFYTGVPDSQLKALCGYLADTLGISQKHIIAANEGNCTALAAGYYLATGEIPLVYMQNSGIGNIVNPVVSLLNEHIYGIPCVFVVGWRGEPGVHDEPQHVFQGAISEKLLEDIGIYTFIIDKVESEESFQKDLLEAKVLLAKGKSVAFLVRKDGLTCDKKMKFANPYGIIRESVIERLVQISGEDIIVSTTGKISRELFEIREKNGQSHKYDFLTVGSMGHSSSIALGIALNKPNTKVWCLDGDGAVLMHMGAMAVIGNNAPCNFVHVVLNNEAHETVGGMPTVVSTVDLVAVAKACGYKSAVCVDEPEKLDVELKEAKEKKELCLVEVKCAISSRSDLGRPTMSPSEIKNDFMQYLNTLDGCKK